MKEVYSYTSHIKSLASMPPRIALKKIFNYASQRALDQIARIKFKAFGADISEGEFARALNESVRMSLKQFKERDNILLPQRSSINDIKAGLPHKFCQNIITSADRICDHHFNILGSGEINVGRDINWHTDFKTGYHWDPRTYYKDIVVPHGKGDIKVPWELSRFQHLVLLGQAYWITSDEKYVLEFKEQIIDWISKNPPQLGPNWACTMDVAIRAANWLAGWEFFKGSPSLDDDFIYTFLRCLLIHGRFIYSNLEWLDELTSNHYLSNLSALFLIACMVPEFKESEEWSLFAQKELNSEIKKQIYEDGCDFEASTCYHRLVLEVLFYTALVGRRNGVEFSCEYNERLRKMFEAVLYLLKPSGRMPQIGDNDSGRFLRFELPDTDVLDMLYLLPLAALYFDNPEFKIIYRGETEDRLPDYLTPVYWFFGPEGFKRWQEIPGQKVDELKSNLFSDAGWYVSRSKNDYMITSCGPIGQNGNGGHSHNDKLSFELCVDGEDIIVDPGSYLYTAEPNFRNMFRSTAYHNTIEVMGQEQNRFSMGFLFAMLNDSKARVLKWTTDEDKDFFSGEHYGYRRFTNPVTHRRNITFHKKSCEVTVVDELLGKGETSYSWNLHLGPGCIVEVDKNIALIKTPEMQSNSVIRVELSLWVELKMEGYLYSSAYGVKEEAEKIHFDTQSILPTRLEWKIKRI